MRVRGGLAAGLVVASCCAFSPSMARAQTVESPTVPANVTAEQLQARLAEVEADANLEADTKAKAVERYRSAIRELARFKDAATAASLFQQDAATAAERVAKLKTGLEQTVRSPIAVVLPNRTLVDLDAERANREANVAVLKQELKKIESLRKQRIDRRAEIRRLQVEAEPRRAELRQQSEAPPAEDEPPALTEAQRLDATLKLAAFERSVAANEYELAKYTAEETVQLLKHTEDLFREQLAREEEAIRVLLGETSDRRRVEAENQIREAEKQKLLTHPLLREEAERNRIYAEEARRFSTKIEGIEREAKQTRERLERQQLKFADVCNKEKDIGLTRPIGLMLREQRSELPDVRDLDRQLEARQELIEQARLLSWRYADDLANLSEPRALLGSVSSGSSLSREQQIELERMAGELLAARQDLLTELEQSSKRYFTSLFELDAVDRQYMQASRQYLHYINERILWIRSADPLSLDVVRRDAETWHWLFALDNWRAVASALAADPIEHPLAFWPVLLAVLALFYVRLSIRPRLRLFGEQAAKRGFLRYGPTSQAALLTLMSAATAPAALLFVAWRLEASADPGGFLRSVALALAICAAVLLPTELLRESCRHLGLAEAHFNWPPRAVAHLRRVLNWMKTVALPLTFFAVLAHEHLPLTGGTAAERLLFVGGMLLGAVTLHRMLTAHGELAKAFLVENQAGYFSRFRKGWYVAALAVPLGLAGLSALGYHYSATQLADRLIWTIWLAVGAVLVRAMAVRWVVLSRRRLLLDQAYQRRAAAEDAPDVTAGTPKPPAVEETDVAKSTAQTRKLVDVVVLGLAATIVAMIWVETLPAIGLLDRQLWEADAGTPSTASAPTTESGSPTAAPPAPVSPSPVADATGTVSITTLDLAVAILLAVFTFLASRNLPGLMEMSVLNRLPVDNATRYAATRLASYAIIIVGVLMATNRLGLRWQNVQWLAAALTVGLGFGLQEVFANFVSGLIILFERPVRVGDIVTIDDVTGVVSRIRMRATTITNWDRKEFIVPNKEFITGRVLNWTLSDAVNRVTINVGVAYGSDTDKAREILLRICDEQPLLLKDPAPMATFEGFGDGTLTLVLRCFLPSLDARLDVIHHLHTRIATEFRQAGIEIPVPQRDLRIRATDGASLPTPHVPLPALDRGTLERVAG